MRSLTKTLTRLALGSVCAVVMSAAAAQAQTTLRVNNWLPPTHPIVSDMIVPWGKMVEDATKGEVKVEILPAPLGPPPASFDIAKDGLADVAFGVHGYTPGRFALHTIAELPFTTPSAEQASTAYWRIFDKHLAKANEHEGVKVLTVFVHGPGHIFTSGKELSSIADMKGTKMRIGSTLANDIAAALGMVPLQSPSSKSYELLSQGVADGILFPLESVPFFKLEGALKHGMLVPGSLYNSSFFVVMNQNTWDKLSPEAQEAVMSVSGESFAKMAGKAWDAADAKGLEKIKAAGISVKTMPDALLNDVKAAVQPVIDAALAKAEAKGIDAKAVAAEYRNEVTR